MKRRAAIDPGIFCVRRAMKNQDKFPSKGKTKGVVCENADTLVVILIGVAHAFWSDQSTKCMSRHKDGNTSERTMIVELLSE
jgi:hypothetical protein